jgi:transcriptional regulator with XRE-family HTH domain
MDYELASRELVRALRGKRSQAALQRRLGRASNVLHAWETGARYPKGTDLLRLVQLSGRPPAESLRRFAPCGEGSAHGLLTAWLGGLMRDRSHAEVARQIGVNRNTLARWLLGETEPRVPQLLALVQATTQRALEFLAELAGEGELPSVARALADLRRQRDLAYSQPWAHAVLRALELTQYRAASQHEPGALAASTGISLEEEQRALRALVEAGQVKKRGGRLEPRRVLAVDTRENPEGNLALKRHWFSVASDRLAQHGIPANGLASYNLFAISEEGLEQARQAHLDYYERLRTIVAQSRQPTRVVLATIGLLPLARSTRSVDSGRGRAG